MDILPIIPDQPSIIKEPYSIALTKLLRANDHKIIGSYVRFQGNSIRVEIDLQSDKDMVEKLQTMKELEIKEEPLYQSIQEMAEQEGDAFITRLRNRTDRSNTYDGTPESPF
jgi:uncharacterized membrane-anchored protein YjiN (DUF445 family)